MSTRTRVLTCALFLLHVAATQQLFRHRGRRVCGRDVRVVMATESHIQPVHKPYITLCQGTRVCSTYKTVYQVMYRQVSRTAASSSTLHSTHGSSYPDCCPGWQRFHSHNCNRAVCEQGCVNGGSCTRPGRCACPPGWTGTSCYTDVDECAEQHPCTQECVNTAGSFRCACRRGFTLAADGHACRSLPSLRTSTSSATTPTPTSTTTQTTSSGTRTAADQHPASDESGGRLELAENTTEEVQSLKNRVEMLEKKLQLVLSPFHSLFPMALDEGPSDRTTLLTHSFRQLDRIESLSDQIGFLEERLGTCSCNEN